MTTLLESQFLFMRLLPRLIDAAHELGYNVTAGELYRTPEQAAFNAKSHRGISNSLHTQRLAVDLQLFNGSSYITDAVAYTALAQRWEAMHELCAAGYHFGDANHYSVTFGGVR